MDCSPALGPRWEIDMRLLPQIVAAMLMAMPVSANAAPFKAGQTCELKDRAKLFKALEGDDFVAKLEPATAVTLVEYKKGRWQVKNGETVGFIDAKWLRKICSLAKPASADATQVAETSKAEPELELTLDMPTDSASTDAKSESASAESTELMLDSPEANTEPAPEVSSDTPAETAAAPAPAAEPKPEEPAKPAPAPAAATEETQTSTKVVNKPKLVDVIRPTFALHESFTGAKRARVVVLDTRVDAVADLALDGSGMAAIISAELTKVVDGKADVVARSDMATLIQRMEEAQLMGCSEPSCMTDIATLAEADLLVSSNVTPAGEGFTLALELLEAASGRALRRETVTWTGATRGLVELCAPQVVKLVGAKQGQAFSGAVQLVATEDEAEVYVDEQLVGVTPLDIFPNLDIGKHTIRVSKPGYKLFEIPVVVNRDGTSVVQAELIKPWYREWWVWTAAGSILAGSVTAYILANQADDPTIYEVNSVISDSLGGTSR